MEMSKLEKVIKGLKCCFSDGMNCDSCPYNDLCGYRPREEGILADALELLKEQKANTPSAGEIAEEMVNYICEHEKVVRCKDCKNADYGTDEDGNRFMKCIGSVKCYGGTTPDFFCADGERRTDDA